MMRTTTLITLLALFLICFHCKAQYADTKQQQVYKLNYKWETPFTAGMFAFNVYGFFLLGQIPKLSINEVNALNQANVWSFDQNVFSQSYPAPSEIYDFSDIVLWTSYVAPALLFFDKEDYPNARHLEMTLPKLARCYSEYTKKNELVIVIQAVVSGNDTVVGFRNVNGGNGSAWYGEVQFLEDKEVDEIGETPFVYLNSEIKASQDKIWNVLTNQGDSKALTSILQDGSYYESAWRTNTKVYHKTASGEIIKTGLLTAYWHGMYIQIDYNFDGDHYVEKFLIMNNKENNNSQLHVVAGPFGENYEMQQNVWDKWFQKVKGLSEIDFGKIPLQKD